ncbi:MAG: sigma-70 family RNA polymerase sigma factor [Deltaproteobacteria bacterium]|nr:sigma-70 family RNA polymerase sigma factor [Deltaproteobacteria bacterium]
MVDRLKYKRRLIEEEVAIEKKSVDKQDADGVFRWYSGYVQRVLRYFGVADRDVPDTSQEVFIVVHRKLDEFEGRSDIKTWLFRICANTASDYRRRAYRNHERLTQAMPELISSDDPHTTAACNEQSSRLLKALDSLCAPQRRVFIMYEIQERSVSDIAFVEDCPPKTVFSRLYAARKHLLEQLQVDDDRLCLGLTLASGRWIDTVGIEHALLPTLSNAVGRSGLLTVLLGKPFLASISVASLAVCLMTVNHSSSEPRQRRSSDATAHKFSISRSDAPVVSTTLAPSISPSPPTEVQAEVRLLSSHQKSLRPLARAQQPSAPHVSSSVSVNQELGEEEDTDIVVVRTGKLDRMLTPSDSMPRIQRAIIANPVDRDYPELADLTEQQLTKDPSEN